MAQTEKPMKISKFLRLKAYEFLNSAPQSPEILLQIVNHFESGSDTPSCLLALEMIFTSLLRDRKMYFEIIPLKIIERTPENEQKKWLQDAYEDCFMKIVNLMDNENQKVAIQSLSTAMNLLAAEGRFPTVSTTENTVPLLKLKNILIKLLSPKQNKTNLITKYTEYLLFDDILFFTWKLLPQLTAKSNASEVYILNYLSLLEKLQINPNIETKYLCSGESGLPINFDVALTKKYLNRVWQCIMLWHHTPQVHRQLLIVLLEKVLVNLDKPLLLTDFLMDSLDVGGPVSLLALQGIFTMIQVHNLDYPNIFAKLYSMFEPEIFHTRYKARLFYLADLFLSSTHLSEMLVGAFAKRLARLALLAPSEDIIVICQFIGNLILRHPGLKCLLHNVDVTTSSNDPYIMEERDPLKSNAINSSLWELQSLQHHVQPSVANAARFINNSLPHVEWDIGKILENSGSDIFDKEIKKLTKLIVLQFEQPKDNMSLLRGEKVNILWNLF
ncbi:nucleolar complex protein 4 homolog B [Anthonomus grandis grandis]|uniref:nucleolar complex protein 4 homolog B n=1 Tax=Anthonomus grandis grandis TaxID=2921223 RepID=UPI0021659E6C|nr:nucleolar complex protein 4 homolog B [Anthonomus grandis grandis]